MLLWGMASISNLGTGVSPSGQNRAAALTGADGHHTPVIGRSVASCKQARSEEHTSELQSLMRISYAVFCLKKKKQRTTTSNQHIKLKKTTMTINKIQTTLLQSAHTATSKNSRNNTKQ